MLANQRARLVRLEKDLAAAETAAQRKKRSKKTTASKAAQNTGPTFKIVATGAECRVQSAPSNNRAPRRPLNSWMAFRCGILPYPSVIPPVPDTLQGFHETAFKSAPQKEIGCCSRDSHAAQERSIVDLRTGLRSHHPLVAEAAPQELAVSAIELLGWHARTDR